MLAHQYSMLHANVLKGMLASGKHAQSTAESNTVYRHFCVQHFPTFKCSSHQQVVLADDYLQSSKLQNI